MNLTQRDEVKFLISYGDKEAFKEWRRDIGNPIDQINPGDFESATGDQAQRAVELMGLSLAQLLEYNRVTLGDIASLGGMIRREHYPAIAMLIKRLGTEDDLAPHMSYSGVFEVQKLFAYSCKHLPAMAWFLLNNVHSFMTARHEALRSAYESGSFPLAKALIAKGVSPESDLSLIVLQHDPNPSLLSKLMDIPAFRLSSAPKKILGGLTARLKCSDNPNDDDRKAESINALYQHKPKIFQENIKKSAELLLCCLKYNSKHAEAINATRALAKHILSSFDEPKKTAEQTQLLSEMSVLIIKESHYLKLHLAKEELLNALDKAIANRDYSFPDASSLNAQMAITFFKKKDCRYKKYLRCSKDSKRLWGIAFYGQIPEFTEEAMPYLPWVSLYLRGFHQAALERTNSFIANHLCLAFSRQRLSRIDQSQSIIKGALCPELVAEIKTSPQEAHQLASFLVEQGVESLGCVIYLCEKKNPTLGKALIDQPASCPLLLNEDEGVWYGLMNLSGVTLRKDIIRRLVAECDAAGKSSGETEAILKKVTGLREGKETEFANWCQQVISDCRDSEKPFSATPEM